MACRACPARPLRGPIAGQSWSDINVLVLCRVSLEQWAAQGVCVSAPQGTPSCWTVIICCTKLKFTDAPDKGLVLMAPSAGAVGAKF